MPKRRSQNRQRHLKRGKRSVEKIFFVFCEGEITEKQYFEVFKGGEFKKNVEVAVKPAGKGGKGSNAPIGIIKRIKKNWPANYKKSIDECWAVIDQDQWTDEHIEKLKQYCRELPNGHLAISNPCFEYWLLLHFRSHMHFQDCKACERALKKYIPDYNKSIDVAFTKEVVQEAITRAKTNYAQRMENKHSYSQVFFLVEKLI